MRPSELTNGWRCKMNTGKVQTNEHRVNVLVETKKSNNRHYSLLNKDVSVEKILTDKEIVGLWENRKKDNELELAKDWIKKQYGYACSNITDDTLGITYDSIVKYRVG